MLGLWVFAGFSKQHNTILAGLFTFSEIMKTQYCTDFVLWLFLVDFGTLYTSRCEHGFKAVFTFKCEHRCEQNTNCSHLDVNKITICSHSNVNRFGFVHICCSHQMWTKCCSHLDVNKITICSHSNVNKICFVHIWCSHWCWTQVWTLLSVGPSTRLWEFFE